MNKPHIDAAIARVEQLREMLGDSACPGEGDPAGPWWDAATAELAALNACITQLTNDHGWEGADAMADYILRQMEGTE